MSLLQPAGLLALTLAIPILALHMLTPRRPPTPVSSLLHWDELRHSITAAEPWQKLRWSLLLLLQLLAAALFALSLARPAALEQAELSEHTVFIVDASGSMSAVDGAPDRLASAVKLAKKLRSEVPDGGAASLVVASANPVVLVQASDSVEEFERAADTIRTSAGGADFESTFALAESLVSPDRPTGFALISDGQLDQAEQKLAPLGTRYVKVGESDTNRAVTDLSVSAGPGGIQARARVESTGGPDATQTLRLDVDDSTALTERITIPEGGVFEETFELPAGARVAAYLEGEDLLAYDNQRYATAPVLGGLKARVHGESTFFVDQLLAAIPDVETDVGPADEVDFEIYVGTQVPDSPTTPFIAVDAPGGAPGVVPAGRVEEPIPTLAASDPILEDIDASQIAVADAQLLTVSSGEVLLGAPGAPLIVRGDADGVPFFYIAFTLERSNLPVNIAFPIIGSRMVGELASADRPVEALTVGDRAPVAASGGAVTDPRGQTATVAAGDTAPIIDQAGFWVLEREGAAPVEVAVNPDAGESRLKPAGSLPGLRPATEGGGDAAGSAVVARSLLPWALAALLALLAIELLVSRRARGVSSRQWRWGLAARAGIVGLIILALINPPFTTRSGDVTTVFVVDVSASLGSSVKAARAWAQSAVAQAGDSEWGVVEFGGDARVGAPLGSGPYRPARGVDAESTNLARGLRLGESMLTGKTRQRLVLVSDGRANAGDLQAEIDRLKALGATVDVRTVGGEERADAAVSGIDLPGSVGEGESFEATVEVMSTISGDVTVELEDDDGPIGKKTIEAAPGINRVTFEVDPSEPGLRALTAKVAMEGDSVDENNETTGAVRVEGPASVLLVQGRDGAGKTVADALESKGLVVETVAVEDLPGLQEITAHRAVILADVRASDLSDEKVEMLGAYTRDMGRGMVTIGGTSSYGAGGYKDTPLEALLPVDSEPEDVEREGQVAEVLLIDTSGSMSACHCSDMGEMIEGGVNKTDISKAAALRAIESLDEGDEVGVLAFSGSSRWAIPLQESPDRRTVEEGVASLRPAGETWMVPALEEAAQALRDSSKALKHIILFTDGFSLELSNPGIFHMGDDLGMYSSDDLLKAVKALADEGITVSVVATGEVPGGGLKEAAKVGKGRFYPGRDLDEIPEIFVKETALAARSLINEGEFYPAVTSTAAAVRDLAASPALLGYVAAKPKPTADVQLRIGELADPLLASWRVGLGKVTSWTSDGGGKWAAQWSGWDGYADFWSNVVRDTFPLEGAEGLQIDADIADDELTITVESAEALAPGTDPTARVSRPDGTSEEVRLNRVSDNEYSAAVPAKEGGAYAVGASVETGDGETAVLSSIASRSFSAEYLPGPSDPDLLRSLSAATGGRGEIDADQAFDPEGLEEGVTKRTFRWWFLLAAALLWPVDVALRRLRLVVRRSEAGPPGPQSAPPPTPTTSLAAQTR